MSSVSLTISGKKYNIFFAANPLTFMLKIALIDSSWYASRGSTENVESVETRNKNKQRIKTNQCAPGWARNSEKEPKQFGSFYGEDNRS